MYYFILAKKWKELINKNLTVRKKSHSYLASKKSNLIRLLMTI